MEVDGEGEKALKQTPRWARSPNQGSIPGSGNHEWSRKQESSVTQLSYPGAPRLSFIFEFVFFLTFSNFLQLIYKPYNERKNIGKYIYVHGGRWNEWTLGLRQKSLKIRIFILTQSKNLSLEEACLEPDLKETTSSEPKVYLC